MDKVPTTIENRYFKCENCGYGVQVYGESYFDFGCQNRMATFLCKECRILFESYLTIIEEWDTDGDFLYNLADETICLRCGKANTVIWNKGTGTCPKCDSTMSYTVDGKIKVHTPGLP
jgi:DNA-directed RNA polymerase subunit RPC12/RpoP